MRVRQQQSNIIVRSFDGRQRQYSYTHKLVYILSLRGGIIREVDSVKRAKHYYSLTSIGTMLCVFVFMYGKQNTLILAISAGHFENE